MLSPRGERRGCHHGCRHDPNSGSPDRCPGSSCHSAQPLCLLFACNSIAVATTIYLDLTVPKLVWAEQQSQVVRVTFVDDSASTITTQLMYYVDCQVMLNDIFTHSRLRLFRLGTSLLLLKFPTNSKRNKRQDRIKFLNTNLSPRGERRGSQHGRRHDPKAGTPDRRPGSSGQPAQPVVHYYPYLA